MGDLARVPVVDQSGVRDANAVPVGQVAAEITTDTDDQERGGRHRAGEAAVTGAPQSQDSRNSVSATLFTPACTAVSRRVVAGVEELGDAGDRD